MSAGGGAGPGAVQVCMSRLHAAAVGCLRISICRLKIIEHSSVVRRPPALLLRTAGQGNVVDGRLRPLCEPGAPSGPPKCTDTAPSSDAAPQRSSRSKFSFEAKSKRSNSTVTEVCRAVAMSPDAGLPSLLRTLGSSHIMLPCIPLGPVTILRGAVLCAGSRLTSRHVHTTVSDCGARTRRPGRGMGRCGQGAAAQQLARGRLRAGCLFVGQHV